MGLTLTCSSLQAHTLAAAGPFWAAAIGECPKLSTEAETCLRRLHSLASAQSSGELADLQQTTLATQGSA